MLPWLVQISVLFLTLQISKAHDTDKSILVSLLARNKEHVLPHFLSLFSNLDYPKENISLFIRSDHNVDQTIDILELWLLEHESKYHSVNVLLDKSTAFYPEEINEKEVWGSERNMKIIVLKEEALEEARRLNFDYILFLDVDVFLLDDGVLNKLIKEDKIIVAPLLTSTRSYSNFWGAMTEDYWYKRSPDYMEIVESEKVGCFSVALVNACVLVNLKHPKSKKLSFMMHNIPPPHIDNIPVYDVSIFSVNAQRNGIDMYICNREIYGNILLPTDAIHTLNPDIQQIKKLKINRITKENYMARVISIKKMMGSNPPLSFKNLGFDKVYCLNLMRNNNNRNKMQENFRQLGLEPTFYRAFDWKDINSTFINSIGVKEHMDYDGPEVTYGDLAQFFSHYFLWQEIVESKYNKVLIFEDNVEFDQSFMGNMNQMLKDFKRLDVDWEFVYLGRKPLQPLSERFFYGSDLITQPSYSQGVFAYMLSYRGACRLMNTTPLNKIIPLEEYISIMFDEHPEEDWKKHFYPRVLRAYAIDPSVVAVPKDEDEEVEVEDEEEVRSLLLSDLFEFRHKNSLSYVKDKNHQMKVEL